MIMKPLKIFCSLNMGQSPNSSTYNKEERGLPFFQGNADFGEIHPHVRIWCSSPVKIAEPGDILISVRAPIGAMNVALEKCCIGRGLAALTVNSKNCIQKYLYYALQSKRNSLIDKGTGSTFKAISKKVLEEMSIPAYTLSEQRRISEILSEIDQLIAHRKEQLFLSEKLVKSRFVEMFGDPIRNEKGFPLFTIEDVLTFQGGSQPNKKYFEYAPTENNIRLIQIRDYKTDQYKTYIPKAMARRFCSADDIMIGRYGPPIFQILSGIEGSFNVALMKAIPKKGNKDFIREFLKQKGLLQYLEGMSQRTAGQDGIQMDALKAYPFPYPPIELQDKFVEFSKQTEKSKFAIQRSLEELETLKKALMQQYFG